MKMKVDGMEGEMGRLSKSVSEITESSSRINENLSGEPRTNVYFPAK
jgi:hypothetical protein